MAIEHKKANDKTRNLFLRRTVVLNNIRQRDLPSWP